jgi:hypothetical protein
MEELELDLQPCLIVRIVKTDLIIKALRVIGGVIGGEVFANGIYKWKTTFLTT